MAENTPKYSLGIALSGGGARGFAHVGALKAIEEAGLRPDVVAGVSAGSIAGSLYAAGVPVDEMLSQFSGLKFTDFCSLAITDREGIFSLDKLSRFITKATGGCTDFEQLKLPLYVGATNFDLGRPEEFHTGALGPAVTASSSIPIVFCPVRIGQYHYVDGGVLRNLPAWTIRDKCRTLIGINCSPLPHHSYRRSLISVAMRSYQLLAKSNQAADIALCDLTITIPGLAGVSAFSLSDIRRIYLAGYSAAHRALKLSNLMKGEG